MPFKWDDGAALRRLAEERVAAVAVEDDDGASRQSLMHELLVHSAELEMQNETLLDTQSELREIHHLYKDLFDNAPVGYMLVDASTKILAVNGRAATVLGKATTELIGERLSRFLLPDEAIPFERYRREVATSPNMHVAEFTILNDARHEREIRLESVCTDPGRAQLRIALTDVTTYNGMLRRLDHGERLGAVERHASSIAHDLNNLLYSILGHADVALRSLEPRAPAHGPLMRLREVVNRCAEATEQLSSFSRAEETPQPIVDLNAVITGMESVLGSMLGPEIELEFELLATDAAVRLDTNHVEQILLTAVKNSRQAMPHGGSFRIATETVELSVPRDARAAATTHFFRWTISDSGIGMTDATRRRAFEPFFTTKPPGVGTGLGLAMVKAAVERAGGFASLESVLGRGTKLVVHLPRATGTSTFPPASAELPNPERAIARVIIVTDEPEGSSELVERLRRASCDVTLSGSGSDALDLLDYPGRSSSVLLVDVALPEFVVGELLRAALAIAPELEVMIAPLSSQQPEHAHNAVGVASPSDAERHAVDELVKSVLAAVARTSAQ
ncbi:MAG TPA: ATP-binding protein [Polyangiaceae bacterium]|jgi:hypothetical protein|nr:ATP-binding protein [Polyangiaceae bacterium]